MNRGNNANHVLQENGVDVAIQRIYRDMAYAKDLIEAKASKNAAVSESEDVEDEEEWTFVGEVGQDVASDDETPETSPSRSLPSKSVIWTDFAPAAHREPRSGRSYSRKSSSGESVKNSMPAKERGR